MAHLECKMKTSPTLAVMKQYRVPLTRKNFLEWYFAPEPVPEFIHPEIEAEFPARFQKRYPSVEQHIQRQRRKQQKASEKANFKADVIRAHGLSVKYGSRN